MRIAHVVTSLAAAHGGPSRSVRALARAQAESRGGGVHLLATAAGPRESSEGALEIHEFPAGFPARLGRSRSLDRFLQQLPVEVMHVHGLWQRPLHYAHRAAQRHNAPLVVSPRGMLSDWARRQHPLRKLCARHLVHPHALEHVAGWHATSPEEARDIRALGFAQPVCVAPNGVQLPSPDELASARQWWQARIPAPTGRPVALFYGRFHAKKRVRELIELWASASTGDWLLLVAGLPQEYGVAGLAALAEARGAGSRVWVADGSEAPAPYAAASLFLLPSHNENFGLAIGEAMAAGVPALVTDSTPWSRLNADGTGWCVAWPAYRAALESALALPPETLASMGAGARKAIGSDFAWEGSAARLLEFYRNLRT